MGLMNSLRILDQIQFDRLVQQKNLRLGLCHAHGCTGIELMATEDEKAAAIVRRKRYPRPGVCLGGPVPANITHSERREFAGTCT